MIIYSQKVHHKNRFVSFMMNNLNYHLDHYLFPGVPCYNLPKLHFSPGKLVRHHPGCPADSRASPGGYLQLIG